MHIAVCGATGKIGRLITEQLLAAGHEVTALVRTPAKLTIDDPGLTVRMGQLSDAAAVPDVVGGSDAVISSPARPSGLELGGTPVTERTRSIVAAMRETSVRRFIGLATPSVPGPRDGHTFRAKLLPVMAGVMFPNALTELGGMKAAVTDSELDWTLARIISRADIAAFWE